VVIVSSIALALIIAGLILLVVGSKRSQRPSRTKVVVGATLILAAAVVALVGSLILRSL